VFYHFDVKMGELSYEDNIIFHKGVPVVYVTIQEGGYLFEACRKRRLQQEPTEPK